MDEKEKILHNIEKALEDIRPYLQQDGGDVQVIDVTEDFTLQVRLIGACGTCEINTQTLKNGIEAVVKQHVPIIKEVVAVD
tara:strand:- start:68 stop:310 length:243 start_codon:yes stop_codon:yes gene_type:complete